VSSRPAEVADNINKKLERLIPVLFPSGVVLGFLLPGIFIHLRPLVPSLFGIITLSGALRLTTGEFGRTVRNPLPIFVVMIIVRVVLPLMAMSVSTLFFGDNPYIVTGFVLLFSGPIAVASFIWVGMFKGDKALCLTLILIDTLLAPIAVPGTLSILLGARVEMNMGGIITALALMVVLPTIVGVTVNETSRGKIPALVCPFLSPLAKLIFVFVIAGNTSAVAQAISFGDPTVWAVAALVVLLSACGFLLARLAGVAVKCGPEKTVTLFFAGGLKNISVVATIAVAFFPEVVALPTITGIVFQQAVAALMAKLLKRRAGKGGSSP